MTEIPDGIESVSEIDIAVCANHKLRRSAIKKWKRKLRRRQAARQRDREGIPADTRNEEQLKREAIRIELEERKRKVEHNLWLKRELAIRLKAEREQLRRDMAEEAAVEQNQTKDKALEDMARRAVTGVRAEREAAGSGRLRDRFESANGD